MADALTLYNQLLSTVKEISLLGSIGSVLGWDERTHLPPKGAEHRSNQSCLLARLGHEWFTSPAIDGILAELESSSLMEIASGDAAANIREIRRDYDRARKVPSSLVQEMSRTEVLAQQVWGEARAKSDFAMFRPWLQTWVRLKRQEADCVGYVDNPYDALIDQFEPGETAAGVRKTFAALRDPLIQLVGAVVDSGKKAPTELLLGNFPAAAQNALSRQASAAIGFDFDAGRLDVSLHPFCSGLGPGDTRLTTRYREDSFGDALFGVLHETGHGLYEQGLDPAHFGTPLGHSVSLGIHESQSRLWENLVGRSRAFWTWFLPKVQERFPQLKGIDPEAWFFANNAIEPSLIRTEADEATYNLHVLLRFELEEAMLRGDLAPADLPGAWNAKIKTYLGVTPPDDARGCLQDIHWAGGAIGYFPTYTLGNLYAAQFFEAAGKDLGDLDAQFSRGEFRPLLDWLRRNIHVHGRRYLPHQLVQRITGADLSVEPLLRHLHVKAALYGV